MNGENKNGFGQKKFLFVSQESLSGDLAWQIKKEGNEVKVFIKSDEDKDVYDGFLEKVDDWQKYKDWADVIVFDDTGFGDIADKLRKEGKRVVGGSSYTDKLEEDRQFGQQEMKSVGMNILPNFNFTNFDEAIKFLKENPGRYVFKPSGNISSENKDLLFISREEDGKDLLEVLLHNRKAWSKKIAFFQLQKFASGIEVAVGSFFNGKEFILPVCVNFEHKRLFPGETGPMTGEMGCYDDQTEVLTDSGWKFFKNLSYEDKICTLNPQKEIEFHLPTQIVSYNHHKSLVKIKNQTLDILVTPNHNMYVQSQRNAKSKKNKFEFVSADQLEHQSVIPRTGIWKGVEKDFFVLPSIEIGPLFGREQNVLEALPELQIKMDQWIAFLGIFLADGYTSTGYKVGIAQKVPEKTKQIQELLEELPFNFNKRKSEFYCYNKQLYKHLKQFGKAKDKYVPDFVKGLSKRQIEIFLKWYCLGDGTIMKGGWRIFYTVSKKMADDVQELLLKVGHIGIITSRIRKGIKFIVDHYTESENLQYEVLERVNKLDSWIDKRDISNVSYEGIVYCATVPNHVMYVRRNGKPYWCGNTSMYFTNDNILFSSTLAKMKDKLTESKYIGYVDINCIANAKGIYPLEYTCRFGYPTISIQMEGIQTPMGELFFKMASGEQFEMKVKKGFIVGVVIAVPPFPFDDKKTFAIYKDSSILFKKPNLEGIHLGEVKLADEDWHLAGNSGYALVITGSGNTMEEARKQTYKRIENIILQNMFYRTDIGVRWYKDSDLLQTWGYLY